MCPTTVSPQHPTIANYDDQDTFIASEKRSKFFLFFIMLPESLKSCYTQYKEDTDKFATWLLHAAEKCGYEPTGLSAQGGVATSKANGKGKAKSKSKSKPNSKPTPVLPLKYKATISELRTIGEVVAKSSLRVPNGILAVARRAVTLRKDAATWFVGRGECLRLATCSFCIGP